MKIATFKSLGWKARARRVLFLGGVIAAVFSAPGLFAAPTVTTLGGGVYGAGYADGQTLYAAFYNPIGIAVDQANQNLYVADSYNNAIRDADLSQGITFTFTTNQLNTPVGVALDGQDNVYVLNRGGNGAVCTNGTVLEFDFLGDLIATNASNLTNAAGMAIDFSGNIYVTERTNLIVRITPTNQTAIAAVTMSNALLSGIAVMPNNMLAVCDYGRDGIYTVNLTSDIVTTNAGFNGPGDGTGVDNRGVRNSSAQFLNPYGVVSAGDGSLIVCDFGNDRVKVVSSAGITTNLYGVSSNDWVSADPPYQDPGWVDGPVIVPDGVAGVAGRCQAGVTLSADGTTVYTTEDYYDTIRMVTGSPFKPLPPPPPPVPGAPTGLTATLVTNGLGVVSVVLNWNANSQGDGVTNYIVARQQTSTNGTYTIIGTTNGTSFVDATNLGAGVTYYYIVEAENSGGISPISSPASVTTPIPPPISPVIGWFDYEFNGVDYVSTFYPITNGVYTANNNVNLAINANATGVNTYYITGTPPLTNSPTTNSTTAPQYSNGKTFVAPLSIFPNETNEIEAVNVDAGGASAAVSVQVVYQTGSPAILGTNAAQFFLTDVTTNVTYYYTTDGSNPLTSPTRQTVASNSTNSVTLISIDIPTNFTFSVQAVSSSGGFVPSPLETYEFLAQNFQANEITWGFSAGEASSEFIASPGETFYAPVTLTTLPGAVMYDMEFDMTETNLGPDSVTPGAFDFQSMMDEPETLSNTEITVWTPIPPLTFIGSESVPQVTTWNGTNFVDNEVTDTNLNELAVGYFEMIGKTNLYNTTIQNLLSHSQAFIDVYSASANNEVIVGGYALRVPTNAQPGEQYQIQINRPSAVSDGLGASGSGVAIQAPTTGSLTNGPINSIKLVTVGQPKYLVGDVYPFRWFNAGDFGNGDLITWAANDVEEVFNAAIYGINTPPPDSDLYDAMDSAGGIGTLDTAAGYWTNENVTETSPQYNALFNVNDKTTINEMAFGDGHLDISDVFVTYLRSQFSGLYWFQRFYTNDPVHGVFGRVAEPIYSQTNVDEALTMQSGGGNLKGGDNSSFSPATNSPSITNTPTVHFSAGDYLATAGTTVSIPITATVFGPYPLRMLMFNATVVPLDGSPAGTSLVTFNAYPPFSDSSIYNCIYTNTPANYAAAYLPGTLPIPDNADVTGSNVIGYLNVTIPANATSMSAYGIYFTHASASPNGLISFPRTTCTGLITLSSRTNSYYNDGIPDAWRLRYFGTIYNQLSVSNADADGTGMNNWQKYQAGLNPEDSTSVLNEGIDQPAAQGPQDFVLYWPSVNGQTYVIERSPTLFPPQWTPVSTNSGDGTYMEIHEPSGANNGYYRVTTQ